MMSPLKFFYLSDELTAIEESSVKNISSEDSYSEIKISVIVEMDIILN